MKTLKESIFDEKDNMVKIDNDTHAKSILKTIKKYSFLL